jgi:hypothetical protein
MLPNKEFVGPISKSRRKADLIDIANGLGIANTGTIPELVSRIKEYLQAHQELTADPKFQKLFMYWPGAAGSKESESKGKNSADKDAEDAAETAKPSVPATG